MDDGGSAFQLSERYASREDWLLWFHTELIAQSVGNPFASEQDIGG